MLHRMRRRMSIWKGGDNSSTLQVSQGDEFHANLPPATDWARLRRCEMGVNEAIENYRQAGRHQLAVDSVGVTASPGWPKWRMG